MKAKIKPLPTKKTDMTTPKKIQFFLTIGLLLPILYTISVAGLNYSGLCLNEMRYLSDQEKISRLINSQIEPSYTGEFIKKNTNCCEAIEQSPITLISYGDQYSASFENRILGINKKIIHLKYRSQIETNNNHTQSVIQNQYYPITNCGTYNRLDFR